MDSFLLRHAASWNIQCSLCAPNKKEIRDEHAEAVGVAAEEKKIGGDRIEVAMSPHYVLVMGEHPFLKIATAGGGIRVADRHELFHLYLQRFEIAREDWAAVFGYPREMRSLVVLVKSESTRAAFSARHWGNSKTNLLYGGGSARLPGGAGNGFILSGRDDDDLHFNSRHMIGHLCISTYHSSGIHEKHLPQWIFRGAAHWLCKIHPRAKDHAFFCSYEGVEVSGSGKRWDDKARKIASRGPDRDPVEAMFQAATAKQMDYDMHVRAWSWFDIFAAEERDHFVRFIKLLREATEARVAAKDAFGQAPEFVDDRWRERVTGKRPDVTALRKEEKDVDVDEASSRELRGIANETNLQLLAGKIRGLERCQNVKTARLLISMIDSRRSERVREVIPIILSRTTDEEVLAYMRGEGFDRAGSLGRATLARVFGDVKDTKTIPLMRTALEDSHWLVQANAARALAQMGDSESIPTLAKMAGSGRDKVKIAAMDALGIFGTAAKGTIPLFERNMGDTQWQVKVATCDAFRAIGDTAAVEMLAGRLDMEGGRIYDAIRRALKSLTGKDEEWTGQEWLAWWARAKKYEDVEKKMRDALEQERGDKPAEPTPAPADGHRTVAGPKKSGPPTYYGIRVYARTVGYVLDTSLSMEQGFRVSEEWQRRLGRTYTATSRMGVCKEELSQAIKELDPRTRLNLVFFNDRARLWKNSPVPAASGGDSAIGAINNVRPDGQTNYYDALRLILGLEDEENSYQNGFADTPDTLFFLTDGTPTDGEITKADELLAWFNERNRFARLRVHVIGMGNTGIDLEFLEKLARDNDGIFLHLTGDH
jgi:hypothetical protein